MTGHALSVRRLRFRGRVANSLATRGRVEMALATGASRLGDEAILCVRRIAIALPRVEKLEDALEAETRAAARPARGPVPANANAVLFADRAELLACLARDWCVGNASASWWWPVLFPGNDFAVLVRRLWLEDARPVPAALERLESVGLAAQFLMKLAPRDVAALWRNIVNAYHLAALEAAWDPPEIVAPDPGIARSRDPTPWADRIAPHPSLSSEAARVWITAILLNRAPGKIRSMSFALQIRASNFRRETPSAAQLPSERVPSNSEEISTRREAAPQSRPMSVDQVPDVTAPLFDAPNGESATAVAFSPPSPRQESPRDSRIRPLPGMRSDRFKNAEPINSAAATSEEAISVSKPPASSAAETGVSVALPSVSLPDRITTEWGGLLYLVNVAISLELYGDFSMPARPGLALPLWDFLALLGERMIGAEFAGEPLAGLFARLSGRSEGEPPGVDFEPPAGEPLPLWLDGICHDLHARVAASLGLGDDCDLRSLVLNYHAKIEADEARVDAHFSLANHPIELRVAGLDRDPGWVPAAGRSIYFHYD